MSFRWIASALVFFFFALDWSGFGSSPGEKGKAPPGVRQSPGGYRSYHLWRGGK